ncbi:hypothetical protein [Thioalkalivibrio sp. XN279]|uniref:hypothetical protein n=1 Tax=Thioalkalivibrio sp. XN279 TaxID=2714953 RepID=UPI00140D0893|nr:hypothetical protein [Thioalkalivibrio sp. XN279]NHA16161.1 hypothetical protein [Thioalkalivibrio sp. XN279]
MKLLLALPLLPLVAVAWLALSPRRAELSTGWLVALVAAFPLAVAGLLAPQEMALPDLLVQGSAALVLDGGARASLLLFGGSWFVAGLLMTRAGERGPPVTALLITLSGALALALARGGPLVYAGMLAVGYGIYAVMASEQVCPDRRPRGALIVLLVVSDLLVFELLLSDMAHPAAGIGGHLAVLAAVALLLRAAVPPAHGWLPPALSAATRPGAVLLAAVPAGAAWQGGIKLLPAGAAGAAAACLLLGLLGAAWATAAGLLQVRGRATLGYAVAASSALLLLALPAGEGTGAELPWLVLALLAACAAMPLLGLQATGWLRDLAAASLLLVHGLAAGQVAVHAGTALPAGIDLLPALAAVMASVTLTVTLRRTAPWETAAGDATRLVLFPVALAAIGLGLAWWAAPPGFAAVWTAPVGITLGLLWHRFTPARAHGAVAPGDLLLPLQRAAAVAVNAGRNLALEDLARLRDAGQAFLLGLWDGSAWSRRMQALDIRLRSWPATSLMMLAVALATAFLLAR